MTRRTFPPITLGVHVWAVFDDHTWSCLCGQILSHYQTYGGRDVWTWALQSRRYGRPDHNEPPIWVLRRRDGYVESVEVWRP